MPISGLVLSFSPDSSLPRETLDALRNHPSIVIGDACENRIPIVVESADSEDATTIWEWLHSLPGIAFVDLVYLHFEDNEVTRDGMEVL